MGYGRSCRHAIPFMWCCYLLMWLCIYVGIMKLLCMAQASRKATPCLYWTPSVASRSCPRLALPTAAPQKLALTLIPTWMPTPALLQLGLSLLSNLRGHNLSTSVDGAAETPAPSLSLKKRQFKTAAPINAKSTENRLKNYPKTDAQFECILASIFY